MRCREPLVLAPVTLAGLLGGCAIPLEDPPATHDAPPVQAGCQLLAGDPDLADGGRTLSLGSRRVWLGTRKSDPHEALLGEEIDGCAGGPLARLTLRAPWPGALLRLGDAVAAGGELWFFYTVSERDTAAPSGLRAVGHGVGRREGGELVPQGAPLWAGDSPPYGRGAVVHDGWLYAYGCSPVVGEFRSICRVARAPEGQLAQASAWQYGQGAGRWGNEQEQALALVDANDGPSLRRVGERFLMVYTPVLGGGVVARTARSPEGPWSRPEALFRCALPGEGWICVDAGLHPGNGGGLGVSYTPLRLDPPGSAPPRLVAVSLPAALP